MKRKLESPVQVLQKPRIKLENTHVPSKINIKPPPTKYKFSAMLIDEDKEKFLLTLTSAEMVEDHAEEICQELSLRYQSLSEELKALAYRKLLLGPSLKGRTWAQQIISSEAFYKSFACSQAFSSEQLADMILLAGAENFENPKNASLLYKLYRQQSKFVRIAVARVAPAFSQDFLKLAEDPSPVVRKTVMIRMSNLLEEKVDLDEHMVTSVYSTVARHSVSKNSFTSH